MGSCFVIVYENRNKTVLVLCPKKLGENWNTYKENYINNPIASDRLNYDVLFHTDLSRNGGFSNGLDLDRLNWENYDLVVIDESHNFRNRAGTYANTAENRYLILMDKIICRGVKTKVLMLSATSLRPNLTSLKSAISYNQIYVQLMLLTLCIYTLSNYIFPSKLDKYVDLSHSRGLTQKGRGEGIRRLMSINLLKRL